jgi:hypothetical protein
MENHGMRDLTVFSGIRFSTIPLPGGDVLLGRGREIWIKDVTFFHESEIFA